MSIVFVSSPPATNRSVLFVGQDPRDLARGGEALAVVIRQCDALGSA